ncbi:MAG: hypothetical protein CMJ90_07095 [Planctomycetes bacterium]|nr:hypothetical protein [Planctomycetota bacterium]
MDAPVIVFGLCGGGACLLFTLQSVLWTSMRMKKLSVQRWTKYARRMRAAGLAFLVAGTLLWVSGPQTTKNAAGWALFGGGFNALIATFHLLIVAYLSGGKSGGLRDRRPD